MSALVNLKRRIERLEEGQRKEGLNAALEYAEGLKTGRLTVKTAKEVARLVEMFLSLADEFPSWDGQGKKSLMDLIRWASQDEGTQTEE